MCKDVYTALFEKVAQSSALAKILAGLGIGAGAGGLGYAAGRMQDPSELAALRALGITEPGEFSVGVDPSVFGEEETEEKPMGYAPYGGMY